MDNIRPYLEHRLKVQLLHSAGLKRPDIARLVGISLSGVDYIIQRTANGDYDYGPLTHGIRRILTDREIRRINREILKIERTSSVKYRDYAKIAFDVTGKTVCDATVFNAIHREGLVKHVARMKPFRNSAHKRRRLMFAEKHKNWTIAQWFNVIFSDETTVQRMSTGFKYRHSRNETARRLRPTRMSCQYGRTSCMFWGSFMGPFHGELVPISGRMDSRRYISTLTQHLVPMYEGKGQWEGLREFVKDNPVIFQQDNAPCHTSWMASEFFRSRNIKTMDWPPMSPDLNPIEHAWAMLKHKLSSTTFASDEDLCSKVREEWEAMSPEYFINLVQSMPKRMAAVIKAKGGDTDY